MSDISRLLAYGRSPASDRGSIKTTKAPWSQVAALFKTPLRRKITHEQYQAMSPKDRANSKNTGLFFGGLCDEGHRSATTLVHRDVLNFDLDDHCTAIMDELLATGRIAAFDGLAYIVHTTRSHTEAHPKLRIVMPASRPVTPAEYQPVLRGLAVKLDPSMLAVAGESYVPAQGMYFPSISSDQEYHYWSVDGGPADVDALLLKYPADQPATWPKRPRELVSAYVAGRRMTHPEEKKAQAPIITATHRAFDPWHFIERFLDHVYVAAGDRYSVVGASGAPSVRIYDDAYIHSDHGSDAAVGQHNTFDLGRIHLFGHLDTDYDTASMSPVEWPSYKAMAAHMIEQPEVRAALDEVNAEVVAERNKAMLDALDLDDDDDDDDLPVGQAVEEDDEFEDLIGLDDDEFEDLIGLDDDEMAAPVPDPAKVTVEQVIAKVVRSINKAKDLGDLERRLEIIRAFPLSDFRNLHRDLVTSDIVRRFGEMGAKVSKAAARRMLVPTIENLRDQVADKPLPHWLKEWVLIASENKYLNLDTKEMLTKDGFNAKFNRCAGEEAGVSDLGVTKVQASDLATQVFCIPMPHETKFHPGQPSLFVEDGTTYANTYRAAVIESGGYKGTKGVKMLKRLISDMFPAKAHQDIVLDFMAHIVRYPHKKLRYALLLKGSENEGKSLLAMLLRILVGKRNSGIIGPDQMVEKFNAWSYEKVLVVMEEVKMYGRDAHDVLNKMKTVITNDEIAVRRMQKDVTTEPNFCNALLTTNYEDCLPLEEDNTRFAVLFTRFATNQAVIEWRNGRLAEEGHDYVRELWDHIVNHPLQFQEFFDSYEFSEHYDPEGRAPWTEFKARMAEDSKTEERQLLEDMLEDGSNPAITSDILVWSVFRAELDRRSMAPSLKAGGVTRFLKPMGFVKARTSSLRVAGSVQKLNVWTRNEAYLDSDGTLTDIGRQLAINALRENEELLDDAELIGLATQKSKKRE